MTPIRRKNVYGLLFGFLGIFGFFFFYLFPLINGGISTLAEIENGIKLKGVHEYKALFVSDTFLLALRNTGLFILVAIPILLFIVIIFSYLMNTLIESHAKGISFWFAVQLIPMILPSVVIIKVIRIFFDTYGVINGILVNDHITVDFFENDSIVLILFLLYIWKNTGYSMVVLLSGLKHVEKEQKEAASLEGAGSLTIYFKIILPQLIPFLRFIIIMGVMGVFKLYRESYLLLGNAPCDEAYMIQNFLNNNFTSLNYDRAMAASIILFILLSMGIFVLFYLTGDKKRNGRKI